MAMTDRAGAHPRRGAPDHAGPGDARDLGPAGIARRGAALAIDYALLLMAGAGLEGALAMTSLAEDRARALGAVLSFALIVFYFATLESGGLRGTLGKRALGLVVTDDEGRRISFSRALGRTLAKLLSLLPFGVGFLMAAFTERHRALHDVLAGTLVRRTR